MHHNKEQQKKFFKIMMIDLCNCDLPIHATRFLFVFFQNKHKIQPMIPQSRLHV